MALNFSLRFSVSFILFLSLISAFPLSLFHFRCSSEKEREREREKVKKEREKERKREREKVKKERLWMKSIKATKDEKRRELWKWKINREKWRTCEELSTQLVQWLHRRINQINDDDDERGQNSEAMKK